MKDFTLNLRNFEDYLYSNKKLIDIYAEDWKKKKAEEKKH